MAATGDSADRRPRRDEDRVVRRQILDATRDLLAKRRFDELSVADILKQAGVARGSFYFYFAGKNDVLAELVREAVARGHETAHPLLGRAGEDSRRATVAHGVAASARLWREQAPVLRAIVENWRSDPALTALWSEQMDTFTRATTAGLEADRAAGLLRDDIPDTKALATALTWIGERLHYLAAVEESPFDDQETLVEALTHIWMSTLYAR
ncbi:TetR/AcrR family transcriptional regulator [Nocardia barduliensis]|uniref:TetR/AcrR family transcriptional regulator n=1 Tax=Nocardia barduliensis TaxID=2736643 RepID=UPI0015723FCA|nr:TetR/AcrR family transcriptional regulator [Nocardia barduliensis]